MVLLNKGYKYTPNENLDSCIGVFLCLTVNYITVIKSLKNRNTDFKIFSKLPYLIYSSSGTCPYRKIFGFNCYPLIESSGICSS